MPSIPLNTKIQGEGYPILCLHGHPGSGQCMAVFTQSLSNQFQTIAPDLRGYGQSQVRQPFQMNDHLLDLEELIEQLQLDQFIIIGWSLGGILGLELALRQPQRVKGLILVGTSAQPRGNHPPISWQDNLYTGIASLINLLFPGWKWNIETFGKRSLFRYLIQRHTPATYRYLAKYAVPAYLQTSRLATLALSQALQTGYNRLAEVSTLECPVLVMAGKADCHITAASSQVTAAAIPHADYCCYPNTAHLFPWEIPHQVSTDINNWLALQGIAT
jgi:proline iminopeptidase